MYISEIDMQIAPIDIRSIARKWYNSANLAFIKEYEERVEAH